MIKKVVDVPDHAGLETCVPGGIETERISAPAKNLSSGKNRANMQVAIGFF
jgi:hypothetical protein